jgi:hypothetical protein
MKCFQTQTPELIMTVAVPRGLDSGTFLSPSLAEVSAVRNLVHSAVKTHCFESTSTCLKLYLV